MGAPTVRLIARRKIARPTHRRQPGEAALDRLSSAYRTARKLGARPLAADAEGAGLSRRELEVMRLVAVGSTNAEIAQVLFLSRRTIDMHVRNILRKLGCRSRVEASHRAGELGLLVN